MHRSFGTHVRTLPFGRSVTTQSCIRRALNEPETIMHKSVAFEGWVRSVRKGKRMSFLVLNDGSTHECLQAVFSSELKVDSDIAYGSSVRIEGSLVRSKGKQDFEIDTHTITVLGHASSAFPLQKKYTSAEHLRTHTHLRPRTQLTSSLLRAQSRLLHSLSAFFQDSSFVQVLPPILTSSDCEGAGETFAINKSQEFFGKKTNLIVSSQLHLEALAMGVHSVWTLVPTFRAERSTTARHLAEFRMLEAEMCFTKDLNQVMDTVEQLIRHLTAHVKTLQDVKFLQTLDAENIEQDINLENRWTSILSDRPWTRIAYADAINVLQEAAHDKTASFEYSPTLDSGLQAEHEKYLAAHYGGPVFVTHYPANQKPFYMLPTEGKADEDTVECFDLLVPSMGELCGGSLREHRLEPLLDKMHALGMKESDLQWYLDLRRYGTVPHGGFGIGWERLVGYLCGVSNVREVAAFPRWVNHCVA